MNSNNFLNIHALISHSPSCLNRDDMNMQKSAYFGGVRRVRISSQCLKRAMRQAQHFTDELGPASVRSNKLGKLADQFCEALADRFEPDQVRRAVALIGGKENADEGASADAVAPWCVEEVARVCEIVAAADEEGLDDKKLAKKVKAESQSILKAMAAAADIALFGRMATSGLMTSIDGAMAVAHVITTHSVDADIDWFTAVDDLVVEEGDVGAGHLDTQEFGAGVFYRYASVNLRQLQENLAADSRDKALGVAAHLVRLMATAVPSASNKEKRISFCAANAACQTFRNPSTCKRSTAVGAKIPIASAIAEILAHLRSGPDWAKFHRGWRSSGTSRRGIICQRDCEAITKATAGIRIGIASPMTATGSPL